jgi:hypothetical protein
MEGDIVGVTVGINDDGDIDGRIVGDKVGNVEDGGAEGDTVIVAVGVSDDGNMDGIIVGNTVGKTVGNSDDGMVGITVGSSDGDAEGEIDDGKMEGENVPSIDGVKVGFTVGTFTVKESTKNAKVNNMIMTFKVVMVY